MILKKKRTLLKVKVKGQIIKKNHLLNQFQNQKQNQNQRKIKTTILESKEREEEEVMKNTYQLQKK